MHGACDGSARRRPSEKEPRATEEGTFLAASFWLADVYVLQGRTEEARALFERLRGLSNDLGLLAEEYGDGRQLGNFPQALSHLSLVGTAFNLSRKGGPAHERRATASDDAPPPS